MKNSHILSISLSLGLLLGACVGSAKLIPGTQLPDSARNRDILTMLEKYRTSVEKSDARALLAMASRDYWEDGGTPTGKDDYDYTGLRDILLSRFTKAKSVRYSIRYMGVRHKDNRAFVEVMIDASYTIDTVRGPERLDLPDQNEFVLEHDGKRWLFLSGM